MRSAYATLLLSLFTSAALAAPTSMADTAPTDDRQAKLLKAFNDGMEAFGFTSGQIQVFDDFVKGFGKRDEGLDLAEHAVENSVMGSAAENGRNRVDDVGDAWDRVDDVGDAWNRVHDLDDAFGPLGLDA
ncbi:hypothetical protein E4U55_000402 [Claviceps digitariae]|nr:hypothetical protein E4U55_000402 [Claviceps digitariae]